MSYKNIVQTPPGYQEEPIKPEQMYQGGDVFRCTWDDGTSHFYMLTDTSIGSMWALINLGRGRLVQEPWSTGGSCQLSGQRLYDITLYRYTSAAHVLSPIALCPNDQGEDT